MTVAMSWVLTLAPICLVLGLLVALTEFGSAAFNKISIFIQGFIILLVSRDGKWPKQTDPGTIQDKLSGDDYVDIVFIRHGESVWNEVFNKGINAGLIFRALNAIVAEIRLLTTSDSVFVDSPLSEEGIQQAQLLYDFISKGTPKDNTDDARRLLSLISAQQQPSSKQKVVFAVSNLRRAIQTLAIGLWPRLSKTKENILVLPSLQEISRNVDCFALAEPKTVGHLGNIHKIVASDNKSVRDLFDASQNNGNKPLASNGMLRMQSFLLWAFKNHHQGCVVVGGHSLWFRHFFRSFLPFSSQHESKKRKIHNCGIVGLRVYRGQHQGKVVYCIDSKSIVSLYRGFA